METYFKGGHFQKETKESFLVENHVKQMTVNWICENKDTKLVLIDPSGVTYHDFSTNYDSVFDGAYVHSVTVEWPIGGEWSVIAKQGNEQYLLNVSFSSPLNEGIMLDLESDDAIHLYISSNTENLNIENIDMDVSVEYIDMKNKSIKRGNFSKRVTSPKLTIQPFGEGVYNLTIHVRGTMNDGVSFNRTILDSIYFGDSYKSVGFRSR